MQAFNVNDNKCIFLDDWPESIKLSYLLSDGEPLVFRLVLSTQSKRRKRGVIIAFKLGCKCEDHPLQTYRESTQYELLAPSCLLPSTALMLSISFNRGSEISMGISWKRWEVGGGKYGGYFSHTGSKVINLNNYNLIICEQTLKIAMPWDLCFVLNNVERIFWEKKAVGLKPLTTRTHLPWRMAYVKDGVSLQQSM